MQHWLKFNKLKQKTLEPQLTVYQSWQSHWLCIKVLETCKSIQLHVLFVDASCLLGRNLWGWQNAPLRFNHDKRLVSQADIMFSMVEIMHQMLHFAGNMTIGTTVVQCVVLLFFKLYREIASCISWPLCHSVFSLSGAHMHLFVHACTHTHTQHPDVVH